MPQKTFNENDKSTAPLLPGTGSAMQTDVILHNPDMKPYVLQLTKSVRIPMNSIVTEPAQNEQLMILMKDCANPTSEEQLSLSQATLHQYVSRLNVSPRDKFMVKLSIILISQMLYCDAGGIHDVAFNCLLQILQKYGSVCSKTLLSLGADEYYTDALIKGSILLERSLSEIDKLVSNYLYIDKNSKVYKSLEQISCGSENGIFRIMALGIIAKIDAGISAPVPIIPIDCEKPITDARFITSPKITNLVNSNGKVFSAGGSKAANKFVQVTPYLMGRNYMCRFIWDKAPKASGNEQIGLLPNMLHNDNLTKGTIIGSAFSSSVALLIQGDYYNIYYYGVTYPINEFYVHSTPIEVDLYVLMKNRSRRLFFAINKSIIPVVITGFASSVNVAITTSCASSTWELRKMSYLPDNYKIKITDDFKTFGMNGKVPGTVSNRAQVDSIHDDNDDDNSIDI